MFKKERSIKVFSDIYGMQITLVRESVAYFIDRGAYLEVHTSAGPIEIIFDAVEFYDWIR